VSDNQFKSRYRDLEMEVYAELRSMINKSKYRSVHVYTKAIKIEIPKNQSSSLSNYDEVAIINDHITFIDKDGYQYSLFTDILLEDLIDLIGG